MHEVTLLAHLPDPFCVYKPLYLILDDKGKVRPLSVEELQGYGGTLITYDVPAIVDGLRALNVVPPRGLVDIGEALRLVVALPRNEGGEKLWNIWSALKPFFTNPAHGKEFEQIALSIKVRPDIRSTEKLLGKSLTALRDLWRNLEERLKKSGNWERLVSVEWPLQSIFARRQYEGLRVEFELAEQLLIKLSDEKYSAYRAVTQTLGVNPTALNFWNVSPYLKKTDLAALAEIESGPALQNAFELAASNSPFASSFLSLIKSQRDEAILQRATGGVDRIYPDFQVMGTISGRILVSDPLVQNLRRSYRSLLVPRESSRLIYLDYAQFEPGILAGLSEDRNLVAAYNSGDIYTALAEELFSDPSNRALAKRVFLAFSYGMSSERLAMMLAGPNDSDGTQEKYARKLEAFFNSFPGVEKYRSGQEDKLFNDGFVSSLLGNRRRRTGQGALSFKEKRWAFNHPVQSTASLIFKEALLAIAEVIGEEHIVLPMHDAVLLELVDDEYFDQRVNLAGSEMKKAFTRWFPSIQPRITVGAFADG